MTTCEIKDIQMHVYREILQLISTLRLGSKDCFSMSFLILMLS